MASQPFPFTGNRLLDRLTREERERLLPQLEPVLLMGKEEVFRSNESVANVYFPVSGVFSRVVSLAEGKKLIAATVGNEGMVGLHLVLDLNTTFLKTVSQIPGESLRMPVACFRNAVGGGGMLDRLLRPIEEEAKQWKE